MMKKIIALMLSVVLLMCMVSCIKKDEDTPVVPTEKTVYEKLGELAAKNYQQIKLSIITVKNSDVELAAIYTLTEQSVSYTVEQLNKLPTDGNLAGVSPDFKSVYTGSAKIVGGEVTELDGSPVTVPSYDELKGNFNFDADNFEGVSESENMFSASVKSPSDFYGAEVEAVNMKVKVQFTESALTKITITYHLNGAKVTTTYEFG